VYFISRLAAMSFIAGGFPTRFAGTKIASATKTYGKNAYSTKELSVKTLFDEQVYRLGNWLYRAVKIDGD